MKSMKMVKTTLIRGVKHENSDGIVDSEANISRFTGNESKLYFKKCFLKVFLHILALPTSIPQQKTFINWG